MAQQDITPPPGIYSRNWGASKYDVADGVHRPLMLTCITFQSSKNEKPLVLIAADLCVWRNAEDERTLRGEILTALSLDPSRLMFCLSHTHSAPSVSKQDDSKPGGQFIAPYLDQLRDSAIHAAQNALSTATSGTLTWHYGKCSLAANRDLFVASENKYAVGFNPEKPADDTLLVGRVTDEQGRVTGIIVNYACHPTTLAWDNRKISPDYIGSMRELVESTVQAPCLFLQGASGELAPAEQYVGDTALADKYGCLLGYTVLATLEAMLPPKTELRFSNVVESSAALAIWKQTALQPPGALFAEQYEAALPLKQLPSLAEIEKQYSECEDRVLKERLWRKRAIRKAVGDGDTAKIPLWVWRLGDSFLIGHPGEAYSVFQQELRSKLSPGAVAVMNLTNGTIGYLPPRELYDKNIYQVWHSAFAEGSLELLIETAMLGVKKMKAIP